MTGSFAVPAMPSWCWNKPRALWASESFSMSRSSTAVGSHGALSVVPAAKLRSTSAPLEAKWSRGISTVVKDGSHPRETLRKMGLSGNENSQERGTLRIRELSGEGNSQERGTLRKGELS